MTGCCIGGVGHRITMLRVVAICLSQLPWKRLQWMIIIMVTKENNVLIVLVAHLLTNLNFN